MPSITIEFTYADKSFYDETGYIDDKKVRDFTKNLLERLAAELDNDNGFPSMSGPVMSANGEMLGHYRVSPL